MKKEKIGQRGKDAEKVVKAILEKLNTDYVNFAFERLPDSRSSGGRVAAQISDFMVWFTMESIVTAVCIPLEVKSTEHDYRLPKDKLEQLPRLKKAERAGAQPWVLVYFKKLDVWRIAPVSYFEFGLPSWDMRDLPTHATAEDALQTIAFWPKARL